MRDIVIRIPGTPHIGTRVSIELVPLRNLNIEEHAAQEGVRFAGLGYHVAHYRFMDHCLATYRDLLADRTSIQEINESLPEHLRI